VVAFVCFARVLQIGQIAATLTIPNPPIVERLMVNTHGADRQAAAVRRLLRSLDSKCRRVVSFASLKEFHKRGHIRRSATIRFMANSMGPESVSSSRRPCSGSRESRVASLASSLLYPVLLRFRFMRARKATSPQI
jgi:hypothetical protein